MKALEENPVETKKSRCKILVSVLILSILIHIIAGIGAAFWIIAKYFEKPPTTFTVQKVTTIPPEERQHKMSLAQLESLRPKPVINNRIQSLRPTPFALPELPKLPSLETVPLDPNALITDNLDSLALSRSGQGLGSGGGFFGGAGKAGSGFLEGSYYDFKFTNTGRNTRMNENELTELLRNFAKSWNESLFNSYYQAPRKLYATRIVMPVMDAQDAPRAFRVNKPGSYWTVLYKGKIRAPNDGTYRFVGLADDFLLVRLAGRLVLDASISEIAPEGRSGETRLFAPFFKNNKHNDVYRNIIGGHRVGRTFEVRKGQTYDLEILVGENPGGEFYAFLFIERIGENYPKDPNGHPILPFFEMIQGENTKKYEGRIPPHSPTIQFWPPVPTEQSLEKSRALR